MRAVRSLQGKVSVVHLDGPSGEGVADPVRVRVTGCGICGSDLELVPWSLPATMGHEFAGLLDDGTAVAIQPSLWCGECDMCQQGDPHLCRFVMQSLHGVSRDGGLADEVVVDRRCLVPLPTGVRQSAAALVEPLAVAVHGVHRAGLTGGPVVVIGGGTIGLASVAAAQWVGADVELMARHRRQLEGGERLGARLSGDDEVDVVIDAAGTQSSADEAIKRLRPGGTLLVVGTWWKKVAFGSDALLKEINIISASTYSTYDGARETDQAAALLAARPELEDILITHRFGLDDAPEAFRVAADRAAGAIKVVVEP
jgi:threonine dehydrogenase-like Zn-dependent dehydrogenase